MTSCEPGDLKTIVELWVDSRGGRLYTVQKYLHYSTGEALMEILDCGLDDLEAVVQQSKDEDRHANTCTCQRTVVS